MDNGHIRQRNNGGFTLLELMIVIVILGILGAIVAPKFMDEPHKARVVQAKMQIENLSTAVKKFYLDNGFYPSTEQGLEALVTRPAIGKTPKNYGQRLHHQDPEGPLGQRLRLHGARAESAV